MRAMFLEFPADRTAHDVDRQYMLGPALLVAPVFVPLGEDTEYYLPAVCWTAFFNPQRKVEELAVWVREGTVLCLGPSGTGRPDYELAKGLEVRVYEPAEGQVPVGQGAALAGTVRAERNNGQVSVSVSEGSVELTALTLLGRGLLTKEVEKGQKTVVLHPPS
ncbi:hypothetical protein B0H21DRAFT_718682 [Amylocystis lapponica]|nr:hypothetical protein B0H21DRAFT_718682 [Amylocystis lapponica]